MKTINFFAVTIMLILVGCQKENNTNSGEFPTQQSFNNLRQIALANIKQHEQFNAQTGIEFISDKGVKLAIPANALLLNGSLVSGPVDLEFIEIFNRSNMLTTNIATLGMDFFGEKGLLISGGEFYINVTKNGQQLELDTSMELIVPADLADTTNDDMNLFMGDTNNNGGILWVQDSIVVNIGQFFYNGTPQMCYYSLCNTFGWTNIDKFYSDPRPKTTIQVSVPDTLNGTNCAVYLSYDGDSRSLAPLDSYNYTTHLFSEHYGLIPIGLDCHIIFVTETKGQWRYAIKGVKIAVNTTYSFLMDETIVAAEQEVIDAINALP